MKVSFIYHFFPHYRKGVIEALARKIDAIFVGDREGIDDIAAHEFKPEEIFVYAQAYYLGNLLFQPRALMHCLFSDSAVFVFLASPNFITTWLGALIVRLRGKRVIFWGHGFKSSKNNPKNQLRRLFFSLAHAHYTYGWRAKKNAITLGFNPIRVYVGFNSLDYETQKPLRRELLSAGTATKSSTSLNVLCISRLTTACRYDLLLAAADILVRKGISIHITFIGDGPIRPLLEQQSKTLNINTQFLGATYDEAFIANQIFHADVTVSPGKVGLTAMHSLMFGTPAISHDNFESQMPEVEAIVPNYTGDFFREGSVDDLARVLSMFRERFPSRELTRSNCFQMIDKIYNPDNQAKVMLRAIFDQPAEEGDDAFILFKEK